MGRKVVTSKLIAISLLSSLLVASCSFTGMCAGDLYESCSIALHVPDSEKTADQKIATARCEKFAQRVFYENGYVFVGEEKDPAIQDLKNYCPAIWTAPMGGPYVYLVQYWDKNGIYFIEKNLVGAEDAAKNIFRELFPKCSEKREAAGVPRVSKY